jgi:hypothetical protein
VALTLIPSHFHYIKNRIYITGEDILPTIRTPILFPTPIAELRPTQITVGFREVAAKRKKWRDKTEKDKTKFFENHMIPVILGPKYRRYILDHHHLCRALYEEDVKEVFTVVQKDLSNLDKTSFLTFMDFHNWLHPFDSDGQRVAFSKIPKSIDKLEDDPFRSLAGELRRAGGYAKDTTPFSEFIWADFLRKRIKKKDVENDFNEALEAALKLAKDKEAAYLPGWCGAFK